MAKQKLETPTHVPRAERFCEAYPYGFALVWPKGNARSTSIDDALFTNRKLDSNDYFELTLSPQTVTMREPAATAITHMQGGGKVVESRGGLQRSISLSGTTGYLPPQKNQAVVSDYRVKDYTDADAISERAKRSGYLEFYQLRQMFRDFYHARKIGVAVKMYYLDFKGDDYWLVEPQEFQMNRDSKRPFSYNYSISMTALEPLDITSTASAEEPFSFVGGTEFAAVIANASVPVAAARQKNQSLTSAEWKKSALNASIARMQQLRNNGSAFIVKFCGTTQRLFQSIFNTQDSILQVVVDLEASVNTVGQTVMNLLRQSLAELDALDTFVYEHTPTYLMNEIEEYTLELRQMTHGMMDMVQCLYGTSVVAQRDLERFLETRARYGTATDTLSEVSEEGAPASSVVHGGFIASGLEAVTDVERLSTIESFRRELINSGDTIHSLAQRLLGDVHRFIDLVIVNRLQFPFIVSDPNQKPCATLAWGEHILIPADEGNSNVAMTPDALSTTATQYTGSVSATGASNEVWDAGHDWRENQWAGYRVTLTSGGGTTDAERIVVSNTEDTLFTNRPWTVSPGVGDAYKLTLSMFTLRTAPTPGSLAFGRDLLLAFNQKTSEYYYSSILADVSINAQQDAATVTGMDNLDQALTLIFATENGRHPFHSDYGVGLPIGRPATKDRVSLYGYLARQSLLRDPRVASVRNQQLRFESGALMFQAEVQPVRVNSSRLFSIKIGV